MSCGVPGTLSGICIVAVLAPVPFGVKLITIEQLTPGPKAAGAKGQVVLPEKSPTLAPLSAGFLSVMGVPLGLPIVIDNGLLLTPTF